MNVRIQHNFSNSLTEWVIQTLRRFQNPSWNLLLHLTFLITLLILIAFMSLVPPSNLMIFLSKILFSLTLHNYILFQSPSLKFYQPLIMSNTPLKDKARMVWNLIILPMLCLSWPPFPLLFTIIFCITLNIWKFGKLPLLSLQLKNQIPHPLTKLGPFQIYIISQSLSIEPLANVCLPI